MIMAATLGLANLDKMIAQEKHAWANLQPTGLEEINMAFDESGITGMPESLAAERYLVNVTEPEPGEMGPSGAIVSAGVLLAGESMIEVCNVGEQIHHLIFVRVPNGTHHESVQALWNSYLSGTPDANALSETDTTEIAYFAEISPTLSEWGPITLKPGTYVLSCFVGDPAMGGMPHAFMGMWDLVLIGQAAQRLDRFTYNGATIRMTADDYAPAVIRILFPPRLPTRTEMSSYLDGSFCMP